MHHKKLLHVYYPPQNMYCMMQVLRQDFGNFNFECKLGVYKEFKGQTRGKAVLGAAVSPKIGSMKKWVSL